MFNMVCISSFLLTQHTKLYNFPLEMKFKEIYSHNIVNEIPVKFSWFNNLHFLMESGSIQLSSGQDEYFVVVMSLLFFTALFKDVYSSPHSPSLPSHP